MAETTEIPTPTKEFTAIPTNTDQPVAGLEDARVVTVNDEETQKELSRMQEEVPLLAGGPQEELEQFREQLENLGTLTEEGVEAKLDEKRQELAEKYLPDGHSNDIPGGGPDHMRHRLNNVKRKHLKTIENTPAVPEVEGDGSRAAAREREIRENLAEIEATTDRMQKARELVRSGDPEAIRAVIDPPAGSSPIPEKTREKLRREAVEVQHGREAVEAREDLKAVERAEEVVDRLEQKLSAQLGVGQ